MAKSSPYNPLRIPHEYKRYVPGDREMSRTMVIAIHMLYRDVRDQKVEQDVLLRRMAELGHKTLWRTNIYLIGEAKILLDWLVEKLEAPKAHVMRLAFCYWVDKYHVPRMQEEISNL